MKIKICLALIITALSSPAFAHQHYYGDGYGFGYGGYSGGFNNGYYGYGNQQIYVAPTPVYAQPPVYMQQPTQNYWYFCNSSNAYYPYTPTCPEGWLKVIPQ